MTRLALAASGQVRGGGCHRRAQGVGVANERESAVVWRVEPLVGIGCPGVGAGYSRREVRPRGRGGGPEAKRAVHMDPGASVMCLRTYLRKRVEGACVDITCLQAENSRPLKSRESIGAQTALIIGGNGNDPVAAKAEQGKRLEEGRVRFLADDDRDGRGAKQTIGLHIPASPLQDGVSSGGKASEVGHCSAGDEGARGTFGQSKNVEKPAQRNVFHGGGDGRHDAVHSVLVPRAGQPVGGERDGKRAACHEAEVAPTGGGCRSG